MQRRRCSALVCCQVLKQPNPPTSFSLSHPHPPVPSCPDPLCAFPRDGGVQPRLAIALAPSVEADTFPLRFQNLLACRNRATVFPTRLCGTSYSNMLHRRRLEWAQGQKRRVQYMGAAGERVAVSRGQNCKLCIDQAPMTGRQRSGKRSFIKRVKQESYRQMAERKNWREEGVRQGAQGKWPARRCGAEPGIGRGSRAGPGCQPCRRTRHATTCGPLLATRRAARPPSPLAWPA